MWVISGVKSRKNKAGLSLKETLPILSRIKVMADFIKNNLVILWVVTTFMEMIVSNYHIKFKLNFYETDRVIVRFVLAYVEPVTPFWRCDWKPQKNFQCDQIFRLKIEHVSHSSDCHFSLSHHSLIVFFLKPLLSLVLFIFFASSLLLSPGLSLSNPLLIPACSKLCL